MYGTSPLRDPDAGQFPYNWGRTSAATPTSSAAG